MMTDGCSCDCDDIILPISAKGTAFFETVSQKLESTYPFFVETKLIDPWTKKSVGAQKATQFIDKFRIKVNKTCITHVWTNLV